MEACRGRRNSLGAMAAVVSAVVVEAPSPQAAVAVGASRRVAVAKAGALQVAEAVDASRSVAVARVAALQVAEVVDASRPVAAARVAALQVAEAAADASRPVAVARVDALQVAEAAADASRPVAVALAAVLQVAAVTDALPQEAMAYSLCLAAADSASLAPVAEAASLSALLRYRLPAAAGLAAPRGAACQAVFAVAVLRRDSADCRRPAFADSGSGLPCGLATAATPAQSRLPPERLREAVPAQRHVPAD
jgi:hypothetical protein